MRARVLTKDSLWRWVEGTFTNLIDDADVGAIVANYRDITRQKADEEKQQRNVEELARYNAELESFAYAVTHDLREPLRTVSAFTQLLVQRAGSQEEQEQYAKFILDSAAHMSRMLDDLLALTSVNSRMLRASLWIFGARWIKLSITWNRLSTRAEPASQLAPFRACWAMRAN